MDRGLVTIVILFFVIGVRGQRPVPASAQTGTILIYGATAHIGNGQVIENCAVAFEAGKITMVADAASIRIDRSKYSRIYDASGQHIYPGFIGCDSRLGLVEIDAVRSTQDFNDIGEYVPQQRALVAYNTDSEVIPTVRSNGVLLAQITPTGATLAGQSSVVQLDAWNWEDAVVRADEGQHLYWPARRNFGSTEERNTVQKRNEQYDKNLQTLTRYFTEARAYLEDPAPLVKNMGFEALRPVLEGKQTLFIHTNSAKSIQEAVFFAEQQNVKFVITGAQDAWMIADFLKEHQVALILAKPQSLPAREDEAVDQPFQTPAILHQKGVRFAISEFGTWRFRNLPFEAGQAVGYGLPYEAAIRSITLDAAYVLGIDSTHGSLEVGKNATLFLSEGDALDMRSCKVIAAFIDGRTIDLDNKHKELYKKYQQNKD